LIEERRGALDFANEMKSAPDAEPGFLCSYCAHWEHGDCPSGAAEVGNV